MNIIEAIKLGKKFRRKNMGMSWCERKINISSQFYTFREEDILADDWEFEEESISITRTQLENACKEICTKGFNPSPCHEYLADMLSRWLGFK